MSHVILGIGRVKRSDIGTRKNLQSLKISIPGGAG